MAKTTAKKSAAKAPAAKPKAAKAAPMKVAAAGPSNAELLKRLERAENEIGILQDKNTIKELHYKYGYYIDKCMWVEAVDLFADDAEVRFGNGIYRGKKGAYRLYVGWFQKLFTGGYNGPIYGFLLEHMMFQFIIDVAPDRKTAKARGRGFLLGGVHKTKKDKIAGVPDQFWEGGVYENEYVNEGGIWKIKLLNYNLTFQADYEPGWNDSEAHIPNLTKTYPEDPNGPDEITKEPPYVWPQSRVVPFHYPHPVTGKMWKGKIKGIGK
ncbi:MAG: nuclear transport factor 2 family protein [Alphaproteobacteria bacterium]